MRAIHYLCVFFVSILSLSADSALQSVGGKSTDYALTLNDAPLTVFSQGLTTRTVVEQRKVRIDGLYQPKLLSYESKHLELGYKLRSVDKRRFTKLEFFYGSEVVHTIDLTKSGRLMLLTEGQRHDLNFVAINLQGTPVLLLDSVTRINLIRD